MDSYQAKIRSRIQDSSELKTKLKRFSQHLSVTIVQHYLCYNITFHQIRYFASRINPSIPQSPNFLIS